MAYIYDLTDTWNASGTVFNGIKLNVTNSASASGSKLMALQVGGTEYFGVDKNGNVTIGNGGDLRLSSATGGDDSSIYNDAEDLYFSTNGSARAVINSSGNVGIGTSSPGVKFQIQQDQATYSYFDYYNVTNAGGIVWRQIVRNLANTGTTSVDFAKLISSGFAINNNDTNAANFTAFGVGGSERARINSSGNLLLGTTTAKNRLTVSAGANTNSPTLGSAGGIAYFSNTDPSYGLNIGNSAADGHVWLQAQRTDGTATAYNITLNEAGGNVAIGTSSPNAKLDVLTSASTRLLFTERSTGGNVIDSVNGSNSAYSQFLLNGSTLILATGATERARIDSSGNLLVGTSTSVAKLGVYGTSSFNTDSSGSISGSGSHKFRGTAGGTTITTYDYLNYTAMQFIRDNGNPTNTVGSITCTDGSTSYNTSSDRRLKKDIIPAADAGFIIDAIEIVSHGWKHSEGVVPFGVIAQDLHAVAPQAVHAGDDADEIESVWGVDYSKLVPMLIKEVQSLRARVAQLEGN